MIAAFARLGIAEKATRQALMRTAADGWLSAEKAGRLTRWHLTGAGRRLLTDGAERIYSFTLGRGELGPALAAGRGPDPGRRPEHPACRAHPAELGGPRLARAAACGSAPIRSARPRWRGCSARPASRDAHLFIATRSGLDGAGGMVRAAWDLAAIEREYERFIAEFGGAEPGRRAGQAGRAGARLAPVPGHRPGAAAGAAACPWRGLEAARLFARPARDAGRRRAQAEWKRLNDQPSGPGGQRPPGRAA